MTNLLLIAKEDFKNLMKNSMWVFFATVFPILMVVVVGLLTKEGYAKSVTSFDYYGITLMIYSILSGGLTASNAFMEEGIKKPNMRIIYAPSSPSNIYLSKILASFGFGFLWHTIDMIILCVFFHIKINPILQVFVLFALIELFSAALGVMFCCIFKTEATANQILSIVINLLAVLGGVFFSIDGYGHFARGLSRLSPAKWLIDTIFRMIYDKDFSYFCPTVFILLVVTGITILVCQKTFKTEDCIC